MVSLLIVWAACIAVIVGVRAATKGRAALPSPEEEGGGALGLSDTFELMAAEPNDLSEILGAALREFREKGGRGWSLVELDCCVRAALAGRLDAATAVYVLEKIGAAEYAERIKGAGL